MDFLQVRNLAGTGAAVKASYEKGWAKTGRAIEREIATGDHVSSILARLGRMRIEGYQNRPWRRLPAAHTLGRQVLAAHGVDHTEGANGIYYPTVVDGRYTVANGMQNLVYLTDAVTKQTNVILELGSGWSANLLQMYIRLGSARSRSLTYVGAEYTENGRKYAQMLADHDGGIDHLSVEFDWTQPDLSFLQDLKAKHGELHVLAFSHHSIEQVPQVDGDVYQQLADHCASVRVVHFEPVGWQTRPELLAARTGGDEDFFARIGVELGVQNPAVRMPRPTVDPTSEEFQSRAAAWWSWSRKYNVNLLSLINERAGKLLTVHQVLVDFDSLRNPLNPTTLISATVRTTTPARTAPVSDPVS